MLNTKFLMFHVQLCDDSPKIFGCIFPFVVHHSTTSIGLTGLQHLGAVLSKLLDQAPHVF